jgi:ABC-type multidrug transport system ATPase subunit
MRSRDNFLDLLSELKREGKTIVFSSHRMEEVFSFADRVLVLDQGKLITDSPPEEVYRQLGKRSLLRIYISDGQADAALKILEEQGFTVSQNGSGLKVQVDSHSKGQPITLLASEGIAVENFDYEVER